MKTWITCPKCGGKMYSQSYQENGKVMYSGFECIECFKIEITSDMTMQEMLSVCSMDRDKGE